MLTEVTLFFHKKIYQTKRICENGIVLHSGKCLHYLL